MSQQGYERQFEIDSFHAANYFLLIAVDHPSNTGEILPRDWSQFEGRLRDDFDVEIGLTLTDSHGSVAFSHTGDLQDWILTNATYTEDGAGAFYKYFFDAKLFESYTLDFKVHRPSDSAQNYSPTLMFHGIDDGYFIFVRPFLNAVWVALIGILAILGLIVRLVRNHARKG